MATRYYVSGYTPPSGIDDRDDVKTVQRQLGVAADGVWGRSTQAAYENSLAKDSVFDNYYNQILEKLSVPKIQYTVPTNESLRAEISSYLRPSVDAAISNRQKQGETNKANLDVDAASRGMGGSTFVSSLKAREQDDAASDIADLESQYTATLAAQIFSAMQAAQANKLNVDQSNASLAQSLQNSAYSYALGWYADWLNAQGGRSSSRGTSASLSTRKLSYETAETYLQSLSQDQRKQLFGDNAGPWADSRQALEDGLSAESYEQLKSQYNGS